MWGPWWGGPGRIAGLIGGVFWLLIIVLAIVFLRRELPHLQLHHHHASPALRLIEERYAKGEITREEFLYRRHVLLGASREPTGPVPPSTGGPPGGSPTYTPGDAHVRVTAAPPPVQPRRSHRAAGEGDASRPTRRSRFRRSRRRNRERADGRNRHDGEQGRDPPCRRRSATGPAVARQIPRPRAVRHPDGASGLAGAGDRRPRHLAGRHVGEREDPPGCILIHGQARTMERPACGEVGGPARARPAPGAGPVGPAIPPAGADGPRAPVPPPGPYALGQGSGRPADLVAGLRRVGAPPGHPSRGRDGRRAGRHRARGRIPADGHVRGGPGSVRRTPWAGGRVARRNPHPGVAIRSGVRDRQPGRRG